MVHHSSHRTGHRQTQHGHLPRRQQAPQYAQMPQTSPYTQTAQVAQRSPYPQTPQPAYYPQAPQQSPYMQMPQPASASPYQAPRTAQQPPFPARQGAQMPQYPQPAALGQPQQVPQLRIVPMPQRRPGEAPPRLLVPDHDMLQHHVGDSSSGPIFEECRCPGYYRYESGVVASGASSGPQPVQRQTNVQYGQPGNGGFGVGGITSGGIASRNAPGGTASRNTAAPRAVGLLDSRPHNRAVEPRDRDSGRRNVRVIDSGSSSDESYRRRDRDPRRSRHQWTSPASSK